MACARSGIVPVAVATLFATLPASAQQHADDNPITSAQDAYGLTLGLKSVGLYSPGLVRGFSPETAGNVRIDGMYFDLQGGPSNRVIDGSTIRVGITEIGYAFPAPTGIVDFDLRQPGGDTASATIIANVGPYEAWGVSVDGSIPLIGSTLVLPIGVGSQITTQTPFGSYPGYTARATSFGATPQWQPNNRIKVRALFDWQDTRDAKTFPLYFTAGDYLPPPIPQTYQGQNWALNRNLTMNMGGLADVRLNDAWSLKAGLFRSTSDNPSSFADLYTNILPGGQSEHVVVGYPDQIGSSTSGEVRLTGSFTTGDWRHELIFMTRGRDTATRYGGEDAVDLGPAVIGIPVQLPEPDFTYSPRAIDRAQLWSIGAAYHVDWRNLAELETGIQKENYHEGVIAPGLPQSEVAAEPLRAYANAAYAILPRLTVYAGYTQGLEGSGVAPSTAQNSGAVLPASLTWQVDSGVRYVLTPKLKLIAGVFELQKPYFNFDSHNIDRELGAQQAKGAEFSIAGEPFEHLNINVGVLVDRVGITGPDLAAEGVGSVAVGQPRLMYVANANYSFPWWPRHRWTCPPRISGPRRKASTTASTRRPPRM